MMSDEAIEAFAIDQLMVMCGSDVLVSNTDRIHACGQLLGHVGTKRYWEEQKWERETAEQEAAKE